MDVIIFAVELEEICLEVAADFFHAGAKAFPNPGGDNGAAVLGDKDQVHVEFKYNVPAGI
ncbi:hypothetical protein FHS78_000848 [Parvibaculum indicum]|nr:hypothetical protein [Parvibaculum indicum]